MAGAFTRSKLCMQFSYACVDFKAGSECLLQGTTCIIQDCSMNQCNGMPTCVLNTTVTLPTLQGTSEHATIQGWGGVEDVPWSDLP